MKLKELQTIVKSTKKKNQMEQELLSALSYTRNNVILGRSKDISSELLMEELAGFSKVLKPAFQDMEHFLHVNDKEKASLVLYSYLNNGISKDLGRFLAEWESIPSEDLLKTLEIYIDSLRSERLEEKRRKDEIISDLIYFPVVLNAMLVLLDFVYVAFFIEQQDLFNNVFF